MASVLAMNLRGPINKYSPFFKAIISFYWKAIQSYIYLTVVPGIRYISIVNN